MPILPAVGRKTPKIRLAIFCLYALLILGGVTMIYPFMIMISTSLSSNYDNDAYEPLPRYLWDDDVLFAKYIYEKDELPTLAWEYGKLGVDGDEAQAWSIRSDISAPEPLRSWLRGRPGSPPIETARLIVADFDEFKKSLPDQWRFAYFNRANHLVIDTYAMWQKWLQNFYTIDEIRRDWGVTADEFSLILPPGEDPWRHGYWPDYEGKATQWWIRYKKEVLPPRYTKVLSINYVWFYYLRVQPVEPLSEELITNAAAYNRIFGTSYRKVTDIVFPRTRPQRRYAGQLWETFVRAWLPASMVRLDAPDDLFRDFIRRRYRTVDYYNQTHKIPISSFDDITASRQPPSDGAQRRDWQDFISAVDQEAYQVFLQDKYGDLDSYNAVHEVAISSWDQAVITADPPKRKADRRDWDEFMSKAAAAAYVCPLDCIRIEAPEWAYQDMLRGKYGSLAGLNRAYGTSYASFEEIRFPVALADQVAFLDHRAEIRKTFLVNNYRKVIDFMLLQGRAVRNTIIYVLATVLSQLTVNPLAAYALSRFRLRQANKILVFLLATMAFPGEVTMIPQFLMLKEFHMLNTYWALILPGLANGFAIFLLKGFFDSLPPELYEAAIMDGASELRMFTSVTLPLSKPILAVIALNAFNMSYGAFMYAFLVCQKRSMWTLMVFLYEFQQHQGVHVVMASLVLASLPTLLVFVAAQKVILRGIVVPSFK